MKFRAENSSGKKRQKKTRGSSSPEGTCPSPPARPPRSVETGGNTESEANGGMPPPISWEDGSEASSGTGLPFLSCRGASGGGLTPFFPPLCRKASRTTPLSLQAPAPTSLSCATDPGSGHTRFPGLRQGWPNRPTDGSGLKTGQVLGRPWGGGVPRHLHCASWPWQAWGSVHWA